MSAILAEGKTGFMLAYSWRDIYKSVLTRLILQGGRELLKRAQSRSLAAESEEMIQSLKVFQRSLLFSSF